MEIPAGLPGLPEILQSRINLREAYEEPQWIEEPFVARQAITLFAGREGEGKSMVEQDAAIRYARAGFNVLVVDVENGPRVMLERLIKLGLEPELEPDVVDRLSVFAPEGFDLAEGEDFMALQSMVMVSEPDVIIIDSLRSIYGASLASPKIKGLLNVLRLLAQRANCAIVILHHTTKSGNTYLGSGAIGGIVEMVYFMLRHKDDPDPQRRVITCFKNRLTQEPEDIWIQIVAEASGKVIQVEPAEPFVDAGISGQNMLTSKIFMALLLNAESHPDTPYLSMADLCKAADRKDNDGTVRRIVAALQELGHLHKAQAPSSRASNPRWVYKLTDDTTELNKVLQELEAQQAG